MRSVEIEIDGKVKRLRYDFNALADIEERAGAGIGSLFNESRIGFSTIRLLIWGGLKHEDRGLTLERAGQLVKQMIDEGYDFEQVAGLINEALQVSGLFPSDENPTSPPKQAVSQNKSGSTKKQATSSD